MKIVLPCWGLGNVMFQYAFLCELRFRGREACCFLLHKKFPSDMIPRGNFCFSCFNYNLVTLAACIPRAPSVKS